MIRRYSEIRELTSFEERFKYLKLSGSVGKTTFGFDRYLNQNFYRSREWKKLRNDIIIRDLGCDLGIEGFDISSGIIIHHMNPIAIDDVVNQTEFLLDPEFLICTSHKTHNAIHYGDDNFLRSKQLVERTKNDTCPWKR